MPGVRIKFEVNGKTQFDRAFKRLDLHLTDFSKTWDVVEEEFFEIESEQFQSSGAKGASGRWVELSPAYEKIKIAKYGTFALIAGPLRATDEMYNAFTRKTENTIVEKSKTAIILGVGGRPGQIARYHQQGGGNLPRREVISFSDEQKKRMQKRIQKSLLDQIRNDGWVATEDNFTDLG